MLPHAPPQNSIDSISPQSRSVYPGDASSRLAQCIYILAHNLNERSADGDPTSPPVAYRARMSLGSLFYDALHSLRRLNKRFPSPPPDPVSAMSGPPGSAQVPPTETVSPPVVMLPQPSVSTPDASQAHEQPVGEWVSLPALEGAPLDPADWMQYVPFN
jgi:hypothetical protein